MSKVLVVDDNSDITQLIKNILRDAEMLDDEPKATVLFSDHNDGWYRKFEKKSKKRNLK
ncbi:MAG: hypothetical protein V3R25_06065 [Nitrosomonadaceae bacterium]